MNNTDIEKAKSATDDNLSANGLFNKALKFIIACFSFILTSRFASTPSPIKAFGDKLRGNDKKNKINMLALSYQFLVLSLFLLIYC
jgi:hypothetical protein